MDFDDPDTIEHLNNEAKRFMNYRDKESAEANTTERSISSQLILLTTVLITVNIIALSNYELLEQLSIIEKFLILSAFGLEAMSTFAGIANYIQIERSYDKWAEAYNKVVEIINSRDYDSESDLGHQIDNAQNNIRDSHDKRALYVQIGCITGSFVIYFALLCLVLF